MNKKFVLLKTPMQQIMTEVNKFKIDCQLRDSLDTIKFHAKEILNKIDYIKALEGYEKDTIKLNGRYDSKDQEMRLSINSLENEYLKFVASISSRLNG